METAWPRCAWGLSSQEGNLWSPCDSWYKIFRALRKVCFISKFMHDTSETEGPRKSEFTTFLTSHCVIGGEKEREGGGLIRLGYERESYIRQDEETGQVF